MTSAMPLPTWAIALVVAALAPVLARPLVSHLESRVRTRSRDALAKAERDVA